ncbi:TerB family tellurite resistance protein [Rubrivirga sp. S365]|uniref:TerB family tellurite resistance protein n=1 Tax=Rubrivirga litoralis TaxID=3075598 RepID=A0ABU3BP14_9BACT|nr:MULTISPECIES: TerB family tellurite resistance protein [unclassified Rubrivirga]MDT0631027.1 TerB family tellurite resistance protein [Rubrivirga sp. F394]MDT7855053.1 TerB family tellurite resistance protein [Rubrivirga sp. S365]
MNLPNTSTERLTQVVHLYLAVADTASGEHEPHERQLAIDLMRRWEPRCDEEAIEAIVDTAYVAARSGYEVDRIVGELREALSFEDRNRLLADLGRIARADGHLTLREAEIIGQIRSAFRRGGEPHPRPEA